MSLALGIPTPTWHCLLSFVSGVHASEQGCRLPSFLSNLVLSLPPLLPHSIAGKPWSPQDSGVDRRGSPLCGALSTDRPQTASAESCVCDVFWKRGGNPSSAWREGGDGYSLEARPQSRAGGSLQVLPGQGARAGTLDDTASVCSRGERLGRPGNTGSS